MELLVKRDKNHLIKTKGKAEVDSDVPEKLRETRIVPQSFVKTCEDRDFQDDLLISNQKDYSEIEEHLLNTNNELPPDALPGIWSGYRSTLIKDQESNRLFRLKGVSLDPKNPLIQDLSDDEYQVFGGQPKFAARFEKQMSDKFNKILAKEGITPIMKCKGYWNYPKKIKGNKYSGSLIEVEGDTRLDEIMLILESFFAYRLNAHDKTRDQNGGLNLKVNEKGNYVAKRISQLYEDVGFITGRLKKLMDKNYQTWSADGDRSNAHIGNIVLYNGSEDVKVGFVDFDASCDTNDFSRSKIRKMQQREFQTISGSAYSQPISLRQIQARFLKENQGVFLQYRDAFVNGFTKGYAQKIGIFSPAITNTIPFERFLEIFEILRSGEKLSPEIIRSSINFGKKIRLDDFDAYGILNKNKKYQDDLFERDSLYKGGYGMKSSYLYGDKGYLGSYRNPYKDHKKSLEKYLL